MALIGAPLETAQDVIVIQHGLPPRGTIERFEDQARELVSERERVAVLVADAREGTFSMGRFVNGLTVIARQTRTAMAKDARLHLVGHSYGGAALLKALRFANARPDSAHFLAPFVRNADSKDPNISMRAINLGLLTPNSPLRTNGLKGQKSVLHMILSHLGEEFELPEGYDPVTDHCRVFSRRFFEMIGQLESPPIYVVLGGKDRHIAYEHAELVARITGTVASEITHVFPNDTHDLESWHVRQVLETPFPKAP